MCQEKDVYWIRLHANRIFRCFWSKSIIPNTSYKYFIIIFRKWENEADLLLILLLFSFILTSYRSFSLNQQSSKSIDYIIEQSIWIRLSSAVCQSRRHLASSRLFKNSSSSIFIWVIASIRFLGSSPCRCETTLLTNRFTIDEAPVSLHKENVVDRWSIHTWSYDSNLCLINQRLVYLLVPFFSSLEACHRLTRRGEWIQWKQSEGNGPENQA